MFTYQFFGSLTKWVIGGIASVHLISFLVKGTQAEPVALVLLLLALAVLASKSLHGAVLVAFTELFVGGHGQLLFWEIGGFSVTLRMGIFAVVMCAWAYYVLSRKIIPKVIPLRDTPFLLIASAIFVGFGIGIVLNNPMTAFDDANSYLALLYVLPVVSLPWTIRTKHELLQVFAGSVTWLSFVTIALFYLFTHLDGDSLHQVYTFFRDRRIAEITLIPLQDQNFIFRIFLPAQIFLGAFWLLIASSLLFLWRKQSVPREAWVLLSVVTGALVIGMSRSLFVGLVVATILLVEIALKAGKHVKETYIYRVPGIVVAIVMALVGVSILAFIPIPTRPDLSDAAFFKTATETNVREAAVTSRWQLLEPIMEEILRSPVVGSGFGKEITYTSDDPRIREAYDGGRYTTHRFEWGYQDIWLKMGLLGLIAFGWYLAMVTRGTFFSAEHKKEKWLIYGLWSGVILLFVAHLFTPYINHPMGSALMLLILPFLDFDKWQQFVLQKEEEKGEGTFVKLKPSVPVVERRDRK